MGSFGCQDPFMSKNGRNGPRRVATILVAGGAAVVLIATASDALVAQLTRIPLGRGTATITWKGATDLTPTISSIKGTAGGYRVAAAGRVPKAPSNGGTASSPPSQFGCRRQGEYRRDRLHAQYRLDTPRVAYVEQTADRRSRDRNISESESGCNAPANINSNSFAFSGTIGSLHVSGHVSQPKRHGNMETARATFNVTK